MIPAPEFDSGFDHGPFSKSSHTSDIVRGFPTRMRYTITRVSGQNEIHY